MRGKTQYPLYGRSAVLQSETLQSHHAPIPVWHPDFFRQNAQTRTPRYGVTASPPRALNRPHPSTILQSQTVLQNPTVLQSQTVLPASAPRSQRRRRSGSLYWSIWLFGLPFLNACISISLLIYFLLGQKADSAPVAVPSQSLLGALTPSAVESGTTTDNGADGSAINASTIANYLQWPVGDRPASTATGNSNPASAPPMPGQAVGRFTHPTVGFPISSHFGQRQHPISKQLRFHNGLDFATPIGTPVKASDGGRIIFAQRKGGYGNLIEIDHGNGFQTRYAHLDDFKVEVGDRVAQQEIIGFSGNTGYSTGPHLHFEVRLNGEPQDPISFLTE